MPTTLKDQALRKLLQDTMTLLDGVDEQFWSVRIRAVLNSMDANEVLSWYGGMGSFNDLVIAAVNGHRVRREQESALNARLDALRNRIYDLARQVTAQGS